MKKTALFILFVLSFAFSAFADSFVLYGSRAEQNPNDWLDWSQLGPPLTYVNSNAFATTTNGVFVLAGNLGGGQFITMQEGVTWFGNFTPGDPLVWTGNSSLGPGGGGPFDLFLLTSVSSVGFQIQSSIQGSFSTLVIVLDSNFNSIAAFQFFGNSTSSEDGSALFIGIGDTTSPNIGGLLIFSTTADPTYNNDFAINNISFSYPQPTPEPSSALLLGTGVASGLGLLRRKLRR